ncbi:hypothetical protein F4604DRAFT_521187 [Suillus subluteus]|nr:hypothetical protein F4604DRAFT_521187 [Suillus subluteus]
MSSRALLFPVHGPLPKPDFQFGASTSASPRRMQNPLGMYTHGRFLVMMQIRTRRTRTVPTWYVCSFLDFFLHYSASNFETRMSSLNIQSGQRSLNEAHLNAASSFAYQHREHRSQVLFPCLHCFTRGSPHPGYGKDPGSSGLRTSEASFGYNPLPPETSANTYLCPTEPTIASRKPSIPTIQEGCRTVISRTTSRQLLVQRMPFRPRIQPILLHMILSAIPVEQHVTLHGGLIRPTWVAVSNREHVLVELCSVC